jgi:hypothetical protein
MTVFALYRTDPNLIEMIAPSKAVAGSMQIMFGRRTWKVRKLTAAEVQHPWVQDNIADMPDAGVWQ